MIGKAEPVEFIDPHDIMSLTEDQIDTMLEGIRDRRLRALRIYKQNEAEKEQRSFDKAEESLEKQVKLLSGNIDRLDKGLVALEKRINNIRALRLQLGKPIE